MAPYAALSTTTYLGGYDMTTDLNNLSLTLSREPLDSTVFGAGRVARSRVAGLQDVQANLSGFWQAGTGTVDPTVIAALGGTAQVVSHTPTGTELDVAYMYVAREFEYSMFGQIGELTPYSLSIQGSRLSPAVGAVRGRMVKARGDVSATGATGTGYQLGAVSAAQYLYAGLHVFSAGTTITAVVESDDNSDFSSATTRITFSGVTAVGGYWGTRVAGAITDEYYRLRVTAITGTFNIAAVVGIK